MWRHSCLSRSVPRCCWHNTRAVRLGREWGGGGGEGVGVGNEVWEGLEASGGILSFARKL